MLRYLRRLSDQDFALDRGMIPLGSCTMKLNATTEMEPVGLPGFADVHPFAPAGQHPGLPDADRRARDVARQRHRVRQGLGPAQRRKPGGAGGPPGHSRLPPVARRARARRLPHPLERTRHQRGVRRHGRHAGRRGGRARRRHGRPRRTFGPSARSTPTIWRRSWSPTRRRTASTRSTSATCATWSITTAGRSTSTGPNLNALLGLAEPGPVRRRRVAPEPAQDVLHPPRRRRARRGARRGARSTWCRSCRRIRCTRVPSSARASAR